MPTLQNSVFSLVLNPQNGSFNILPIDTKFPSLCGARFGARYLAGGKVCSYPAGSPAGKVISQEMVELPGQGTFEQVHLVFPADEGGIRIDIQMGILQEYPLALWKISLHNEGTLPVLVERIDLLRLSAGEGGKVNYQTPRNLTELGFFSNGWQSWSPSRWYRADSKMNISNLHGLQTPMIYNPGTPRPHTKGRFSSDMFAVVSDNIARTGFLVGFLSQEQHFGSILADFKSGELEMWANGDDARLDPDATMETDWAVFNPVLLDHRDPLDKYLEAAARQNQVHSPKEAPVGWCSWYHFYENVTAKNVDENLQKVIDLQEKLPIQLVQLDDGFETRVGDWFSFKPAFPEGVAPLAKKITGEGLLPGLWLAPFAVHPKSALFQVHPEWLLRTKNGKPANAGLGWGSLFHGLDLTVPEALDYASRVVRMASGEWGYPYLKLDFLYAAALKGLYRDKAKTRAQVLRLGMQAIRDAVGPEVMLLGCGLPLGSGLGLVDFMRIGPDVSGGWVPEFNGIKTFLHNEPGMPCARNSIHNILTRADFHNHWWVNDPDCLLVRADTKLTEAEVRSLAAVIALTGGSVLLSDDLPNLDLIRLEIATRLLPVNGERARILDRFDSSMPERLRLDLVDPCGERHILARFNWTDQPLRVNLKAEDFQLEAGTYRTREFWSGEVAELSPEKMAGYILPAHGGVVLSARRMDENKPLYLGSDLHLTQGIELAEWQPGEKNLTFTLRLPRRAEGNVVVQLPGAVLECAVNGEPGKAACLEDRVYSIPVKVDGFSHILLKWN